MKTPLKINVSEGKCIVIASTFETKFTLTIYLFCVADGQLQITAKSNENVTSIRCAI